MERTIGRWSSAAALAGLVVACFVVAGLGSMATMPQIGGWYRQIEKPSWNPPDWVFGPAWTTLYLMMAVSAWLVWRRRGFKCGRVPLTWFGIQLALNCTWSFAFFAMQSPGLGLLNIAALWLAIAGTIVAFWGVDRLAAALLVPYISWVSFAATLNFAIWQMN